MCQNNHQEVPQNPQDKIRQEILTCQSSCEDSQNVQSGKVSSISRMTIYAIIGTIWFFLSQKKNSLLFVDNKLLKWTIIACFIYLLVDITHYFIDACRYRYNSFKLDGNDLCDECKLNQCKKALDNIAIWSFIAIVIKFILVIATSVVFLFGMINYLNIQI